jgi:hypothetical protein
MKLNKNMVGILEGLEEKRVKIDETRLSHNQIKWLFANGCASSGGKSVKVDWSKAEKAGWNLFNRNGKDSDGGAGTASGEEELDTSEVTTDRKNSQKAMGKVDSKELASVNNALNRNGEVNPGVRQNRLNNIIGNGVVDMNALDKASHVTYGYSDSKNDSDRRSSISYRNGTLSKEEMGKVNDMTRSAEKDLDTVTKKMLSKKKLTKADIQEYADANNKYIDDMDEVDQYMKKSEEKNLSNLVKKCKKVPALKGVDDKTLSDLFSADTFAKSGHMKNVIKTTLKSSSPEDLELCNKLLNTKTDLIQKHLGDKGLKEVQDVYKEWKDASQDASDSAPTASWKENTYTPEVIGSFIEKSQKVQDIQNKMAGVAKKLAAAFEKDK